MSVKVVVGFQLNEGEVVGSCAARGTCDVIWNFDR